LRIRAKFGVLLRKGIQNDEKISHENPKKTVLPYIEDKIKMEREVLNAIVGIQLDNNVIQELCRCGHTKTTHNPEVVYPTNSKHPILINGHGECLICECSKFTWAKFVYTET
jgi:hypothetical protein